MYPSNPYRDCVMGFFGHFFNRQYITTSLLISFPTGAFQYNSIFTNLGYKPIEHEMTSTDRWRMGGVFFFIYGFCLLEMLAACQILKYLIWRKRASSENFPKRLKLPVRGEHDTPSMPSGDTTAAASFCYIYGWCLNAGWLWVILPFVMMGRVYY